MNANQLNWEYPKQYNTHRGSQTRIAERGDNLYIIFTTFNAVELTVVTAKRTVFKRTDLGNLETAMLVAESII